MSAPDRPRKQGGSKSYEQKPFRVILTGLGITISSFQPKAVQYADKVCILHRPWDGPVPDGTIALRYEPPGRPKIEHWERWYPTLEASEFLQGILGDKGVRFARGDGKLQLLVNGQEVNSWPTTEAVKKTDWEWLLPVANEYLDPEVLATMFPKTK